MEIIWLEVNVFWMGEDLAAAKGFAGVRQTIYYKDERAVVQAADVGCGRVLRASGILNLRFEISNLDISHAQPRPLRDLACI